MKPKTDLSRIPTTALWKELERREANKYTRRVNQEYRWRNQLAAKTRDVAASEPQKGGRGE